MERRWGGIIFRDLSEKQLLDLYSLESFSAYKEEIVGELQARGSGLSFDAFRIAYPDHKVVYTGKGLGGFFDVDGNEVAIELRQLVATNNQGKEVRSSDYI